MCCPFLPVPQFIGRVKVPLKVAFFGWTTTIGKILALDNLRKRNVIVVDWCCMCKRSRESIDHLLHCEVTRELWVSIFRLFGVELCTRFAGKMES